MVEYLKYLRKLEELISKSITLDHNEKDYKILIMLKKNQKQNGNQKKYKKQNTGNDLNRMKIINSDNMFANIGDLRSNNKNIPKSIRNVIYKFNISNLGIEK